MLKHLIILANLTLVFGYSGKRKEKLKWDVMYTPETCPIKVQYGDMALIYFKIYKKINGDNVVGGLDGYEAKDGVRIYKTIHGDNLVGGVDGYEERAFALVASTVGFDMPSYFNEQESQQESQNSKGEDNVHYQMAKYPLRVQMSTVFRFGFEIRGFEQAILGMCMGEKRTLYIPEHMTYETSGGPSGGAVKLELDVYKVEPGLRTIEELTTFDLDRDRKLDKDEFENYLNQESVNLYFRKHPYAEKTGATFQSLNLKRSWGKKMFRNEDANEDKFLSFEEFKVFGREERHHWDKNWDLRTREGQEILAKELHGIILKKEKDE